MVDIVDVNGKPIRESLGLPATTGEGTGHTIIVQPGGILNYHAAAPAFPNVAPTASSGPTASSAPGVSAASPVQPPADAGAQNIPFANRLQDSMNSIRSRVGESRVGEFLATPRNRLLAGVAALGIVVVSAATLFGRGESDPNADAHSRAMTKRMLTENPLLKCEDSKDIAACISGTVVPKTELLREKLKEDTSLGCSGSSDVKECESRILDDISFHGGVAVSPQAVRVRDAERLLKSSAAPAGKTLGNSLSTSPAADGIFSSGLESEKLVHEQSSDAQSGRTTPFININVDAVAPPAIPPATLSLLEQLNVVAAQNISFEHNSAKLDTEGKRILREIGLATQAMFQSDQDVCLKVEGYASKPGETYYNLDLSGQRAHEVSRFLIGKFNIPANRIHPITQNDLRHNIQQIHLGEESRGGPEEYDRIVKVRIGDGPCL